MKKTSPIFTVFNNEHAIFIDKPEVINAALKSIFLANQDDLQHFLDVYLNEHQSDDIILYSNDNQKLFKYFSKYFKYVKAGGGLVKNQNSEYLMIKRFGLWDLPKGILKKGESPEVGAIREVEEETNMHQPFITEKLPDTYHIYREKEKYILKKTYWFAMKADGKQSLKPQTEEKITEAVWLSSHQCRLALRQSYRSLNDILAPYITD